MEVLGKEPVWAIVELFGHQRHAGLVQEAELFGVRMGRVDVPDAKDPAKTHATHLFAGSSVFRFTPCTEETARRVAAEGQGVWTAFQLTAGTAAADGSEDEPDEDDGF